MNLGISNIAWDFSDDELVYEFLYNNNVGFLEVAPARINPNINSGLPFNLQIFQDKFDSYKLNVRSAQAILFGTNDLSIFHRHTWNDFYKHLNLIFKFCNVMGISKIVFGSPKSRKFNNSYSISKNVEEASIFFTEVSKIAQQYNLLILVEANPKQYDCDFLNSHEEVGNFISSLCLDNIKMQIDTGAALMNGQRDIDFLINGDFECKHVHLSLPFLNSNYDLHRSFFISFINKLIKIGYEELVIVEMKNAEDSVVNVYNSINFFKDLLKS
jgi:sugar phosphate isomerase/epimerase